MWQARVTLNVMKNRRTAMGNLNPKVDAYIERSPEFARMILSHLRALVHRACPEATETIKWGFPNFEYKGILCNMAAFKGHCAFSFWKASLMSDRRKMLSRVGKTSMGQFGHLKDLADLPAASVILAYLKDAMALNEKGAKVPVGKARTKPPVRVPADFKLALSTSTKARETFDTFSTSHRREYIEWLTSAKTKDTRKKRLATAIQWLEQGKVRDWKYARR